jgi:phosphate:Na+ symporter
MDWQILISVITGLIIFIYGIENFSKEILRSSGDKFRKILKVSTKNRFTGTLLGTLITAIIQSSTATTVITVGLVSAGLISFLQSLGIILGANIGTTITAQLVALKVTAFAPIFMILGFFISIFSKEHKYIGKGFFYFGLVFFGLTLVSGAIEPIKHDPQIIEMFAKLSNIFIAVLAGFIFTAIVQSSTVTTGIVVILASTGLITLQQGIPILLGTNIGTTVTTIIAASRLNLHAKRAAAAHTLFNVVSVILIIPFIAPFAAFISTLGGSQSQQIANAHSVFNVGATLVFLTILKPFKRLIEKIVKGNEEEILLSTKYLNKKLPKTNKSSFNIIEKELNYFLDITYKLFEKTMVYIEKRKDSDLNEIEKLEILSDLLDEKIKKVLVELSERNLTKEEAKKVVLLVRISSAIEQLGDKANHLSKIPSEIKKITLPEEFKYATKEVYNLLNSSFIELRKNFPTESKYYKRQITKLDSIESTINKNYGNYVQRHKSSFVGHTSTFLETSALMESSVRKIKEILCLTDKYSQIRIIK